MGGKMKEETKSELKENRLEMIDILERTMIILEDNPKIKDVSGFYEGKELVDDIHWVIERVRKEVEEK